MVLSSIMTPAPRTIRPDTGLDEALALMDLLQVRHLPVLDGEGRLEGLVTDRDLFEATGWIPGQSEQEDAPRAGRRRPAKVEHVMIKDVRSKGPGDSILEGAVELLGSGIGCLPILRGGQLVGVVTEVDVLEAYLRRAETAPGGCDGTEIRHLMTERPVTCSTASTLAMARRLMRSASVRHLPVLVDGELTGILSDRDLRRAHGAGRSKDTPVEELMTRDVLTLSIGATACAAARAIARNRISAVPVVAGPERPLALLGIVTVADLIEHALAFLRGNGRMTAAS